MSATWQGMVVVNGQLDPEGGETLLAALDAGELPDTGGERPHVTVLVDLATLQETARRLACDARVSRTITDGASQPLDVGRATRSIPPAIRRAVTVRDGGCAHLVCDRPPAWCDVHHLVAWATADRPAWTT